MRSLALGIGVMVACVSCTVAAPEASFACLEEGAACSDGNPCTSGDSCQAGVCVGGTPLDYDACCAAIGGPTDGVCASHEGGDWHLIPSGKLWMGCNGAVDLSCQSNESPQHEVDLSAPFWIERTEVTVAAWKACAEAGACDTLGTGGEACNWGVAGREDHPINCVNWHQATAYCAWVGGELPTEAQWELAARGRCEDNPTADDGTCAEAMRIWPWGDEAPACGETSIYDGGEGAGCNKGRTWPAGDGTAKGLSPFGLKDMAGNVWEWTADSYDESAYTEIAKTPAVDPLITSGEGRKTRRGGGFKSAVGATRASTRAGELAEAAGAAIGFRCVRNL
mgnify:CR=1 FL=1